jgi:hypothetical protein
MPITSVIRACGHKQDLEHAAPFPGSLAALARQSLCSSCEAADLALMPALEGTEQEVARATEIRRTKLAGIREARKDLQPADVELHAALGVMVREASAAWWIDARDFTADDLLDFFAEDVQILRAGRRPLAMPGRIDAAEVLAFLR